MSIKLCIDPGHGFANVRPGQYDSGATGGGVAEADITLAWALTLKWVCQRKGIDFWLTRDDDKDPDPVGTRDDRAEAAGCTHFIALHCNSGPSTAIGVEAFYRDTPDKQFAEIGLLAAVQAMQTKSRGLKVEGQSQHSRLAVFDFDGPTTLVELGFITNSGERAKLLSRDVRLKFAESLTDRILELYT